MWVSVHAAERLLEASPSRPCTGRCLFTCLPPACLCAILLLHCNGRESGFWKGQVRSSADYSYAAEGAASSLEEEKMLPAGCGWPSQWPHHGWSSFLCFVFEHMCVLVCLFSIGFALQIMCVTAHCSTFATISTRMIAMGMQMYWMFFF